jgi:hypothetical protein
MLSICAASLAAASTAHAVTVYDNGGPQAGGNAQQISSFVSANDFTIASETTLSAFTFWSSVAAGNTFAGSFSGTVGWAIFTDNGTLPGTLIFSGQDSTVTTSATALVNLDGGEIVQVDADFTAGLLLQPGTYWLAIHEGNWGSLFDGTEIFWQRSATVINDPIRVDPNESNPVNWPLVSQFDGAFLLTGTPTAGGPGNGDPGNGDPGNGDPGNGDPGNGDPGNGDPGNPGSGNGAALPEPASATMCLLSLAMLAARRRR